MERISLSFREFAEGDTAAQEAINSYQPVQLLIEKDGINFPLRIVLSARYSDRLLAQYNGSLRRKHSKDGIKFQRVNWTGEYHATTINFADPTLTLDETIQLGWGQLDGSRFAPQEYVEILQVLRDVYGIPEADRTVHFGTSAGGYQAMATSIFDRGSFAVTNNPQLDWRKWPTANTVEDLCYGDDLNRLDREDWRSKIWQLAKREKYVPRFRIFVNMGSANDYEYQLKGLINGLRDIEDGYNNFWDCDIQIYRDRNLGHTPLPWNALIPEVNSALEHQGRRVFQPSTQHVVTAVPGMVSRPVFSNPRTSDAHGNTKPGKIDSTGFLYMNPSDVVDGATFQADLFICQTPGNATFSLEFPLSESDTGDFCHWQILISGSTVAEIEAIYTHLPVNFLVEGLAPGDIVSIAIRKVGDNVHHSKYKTARVRPVTMQFEEARDGAPLRVSSSGAKLVSTPATTL